MRMLGRLILQRYLTASVFLAGFVGVTAAGAVLPARDRSAVAAWAGHTTAIAVAAGCVLGIWARRARGRGRPRPGATVGPALDTPRPQPLA
jgi:hypothetical protein